MQSARVSRSLGSVHDSGGISASHRLPVSGRVRPGIKVLTAAASKVPGLREKYQAGLDSGVSFDDIAAAMKAIPGAPNYPLTPKNVGYFTVRQGDFSTPGAAAAIMDAHGEVREGDPERRLYAFPIVFPSDDVDLIFTETFEAYRASELLHWSEPGPDGLQCMRRVPAQAEGKSARRRFGGRPAESVGPCNPNTCDLFGAGDCKHVATLNFWVPGVLGSGVISMTFTSIYASLGIAETLEMVRAGLGRISGLHNGKPIFWLSKGHEKVSRMNWETGKPEKATQWIIRIEASGLDMMAVLAGTGHQVTLPAPVSPAALPAPAETEQHPAIEPEPPVSRECTDAARAAREEAARAETSSKVAAVTEARAYMAALFSTLGWDRATQGEWLADNHPDPKTAATDAGELSTLNAKLESLAKALAGAAPAPTEVPPAAALVTDSDVPF